MASARQPLDSPQKSDGNHVQSGDRVATADTVHLNEHTERDSTLQTGEHGYTGQGRSEQVHFEDVSAGEDAQQIVVSTQETGVYGKKLVVEARGRQWLGQMEASSIKQVSQDRTNVLLKTIGDKESSESLSYNRAYGAGRRLNQS